MRSVCVWWLVVLSAAIAAAAEPEIVPGLIVPADLPQQAARQSRVAAPIVRALRDQASGRPLGPQVTDRRLDWSEKIAVDVIAQGSCGSCWACATACAMSFQIGIQTGRRTVNVSAQDVLNCSGAGSCGGGWTAYDAAIKSGYADAKSVPYVGRKTSCRAGVARPYKILAWEYLAADGAKPTDARIKQALVEAGPVWVGIYADRALTAYKPGTIWSSPGRSVNHAVVVIGWDDDRRAWLVRNSWGASWGDRGNFWCRMGSNVGSGASVAYVTPSWIDQDAAESLQAIAADDCQDCDQPTIDGPRTAAAGALVKLTAPQLPEARYAWSHVPAAAIDENTYLDSSRRVLIVATPVAPGTYWFSCSVACANQDPLLLQHGLTVEGTPGPAPPGPSPEPPPPPTPPTPPKPSGLDAFGRQVKQWATDVPAASRTAAGEQIAAGFESVMADLRAGRVETLGEAQARVRGKYSGALRGQVLTDWLPFFDQLSAAYVERKDDLADAETAAAAAEQVAAGIRAALSGRDPPGSAESGTGPNTVSGAGSRLNGAGATGGCSNGMCPAPRRWLKR